MKQLCRSIIATGWDDKLGRLCVYPTPEAAHHFMQSFKHYIVKHTPVVFEELRGKEQEAWALSYSG